MNTSTNTVQGPQKMMDSLPKFCPVNVKLATLNLNGGLTHISGREKIVHTMERNNIDILALQETRVNANAFENHGGYTFFPGQRRKNRKLKPLQK